MNLLDLISSEDKLKIQIFSREILFIKLYKSRYTNLDQ